MFEELRPHLFSVAYGILGSAADAEDMVQEAYLRFVNVERDSVRSPAAYLRTIVARLSYDQLKSARAQREQYFGPWLPTPVVTKDLQPDQKLHQKESLSMALLVMLERLSPLERVAYVLREVFNYGYAEVAEVLGRSESACRKLNSRAAERLKSERRYSVEPEMHREVLDAFYAAIQEAEVRRLVELLAEDAVLISDGGGKVPALAYPVKGAERIAEFLQNLQERHAGTYSSEWESINHQPALLIYDSAEGTLTQVILIHTEHGKINDIWMVRNPHKLQWVVSTREQPSGRGRYGDAK